VLVVVPVLQHVQEKVVHLIFGHNFCESRPIFKILSLIESKGNSLSTYHRDFTLPELCFYTTLWKTKIQNSYQLLLLSEIFNLFYTKVSKF